MKPLKTFGLAITGVLVALLLGAYTTYDYGLKCTKCLLGKHVVIHRFVGIPFFKSSTSTDKAADYEGIVGHRCNHIFRQGGFGRGSYSLFGAKIGCGVTREGSLFRSRIGALTTTYQLCRTLADKSLARDTINLLEKLMPPNTSQRAQISDESLSAMWQLDVYLRQVTTIEQWRSVLQCAEEGFREVPNLPEALSASIPPCVARVFEMPISG